MSSKQISKSKKSVQDNDHSVDIRNFVKAKNSPSFTSTSVHTNHQQEFDHPCQHQFVADADNEQIKENEFMEFFQVNKLINTKYLKNNSNHSQQVETYPQLSSEQLMELTLLFKLSGESEFIHQLGGSYHGRLLVKQINLCLDTLKYSYEMCPEKFKESLNDLVQKYQKGLQNNNL